MADDQKVELIRKLKEEVKGLSQNEATAKLQEAFPDHKIVPMPLQGTFTKELMEGRIRLPVDDNGVVNGAPVWG
ncbi:unnamed protein product, partial [Didymodactylos carnosus]